MSTALVIVESPAKAKTIGRFLGDDFLVESSVGHVRDLPASAKEMPEAYKKGPYSRYKGVNVDDGFKPLYVVKKRDVIRDLKRALADADELYLATDEDREGEAIAWHLLQELNPRVPVKRMVFHEITERAIREAVDNPRELDQRLVDAQETRRILDRLYGYDISHVLRLKAGGPSGGRVQSVATRLVVERERERMAFTAASWWDVTGTFAAREQGAEDFAVRSVESKPSSRKPRPPFITSTFQQAAGSRLRISAAQAMQSAQSLYQGGYITYMRTDSTTLSDTAVRAARSLIEERWGRDHLPDRPRTYSRKVKNAQEAHEAIRPAGDRFRHPDEVAREVNPLDARVYELIWRRTVASQMADARVESTTMLLGAIAGDGRDVQLKATGTVVTFAGHLAAYESFDDDTAKDDDGSRLPRLAEGSALDARDLAAEGHETKPPRRYTEASLVKRMEELGVGRPSTYAAVISTIQDRGYIFKKGSALVPTWTAFSVVTLLERHFPQYVDYAFTARMEDDLDAIARGDEEMVPWLERFYRGNGDDPGLLRLVTDHIDEIDAAEINTFRIGVDADGNDVVAKPGRYGPYVKRGDDTASIPEQLPPDELTVERALELLNAPKGDVPIGTDPASGLPVFAKSGRFGPYVQLGDPDELPEGWDKPKMESLFSTMSLETITLEQALRLLSLPRRVGQDDDGVDIVAMNGRYGPYVRRGDDTRSLETEEELFTVDRDAALRLLAEPKRRRGQGRQQVLRELGEDLVSGQQVTVRDGRFGPYVTDGETNASLRKGDQIETITLERASELLQVRRDTAPAKKKKRAAKKRAGKKRAGKKRAAAKAKPSARKASTTQPPAGGRSGEDPGADEPAAGNPAADEPGT